MRKLGQVLGFEAMSLYNHVANKDDLLDGILDLVLAESEPPSPDGRLGRGRSSQRDLDSRGAPAPQLVVGAADDRAASAPRGCATWTRCSDGSARPGFSADTTYTIYHVLDGHIFGFSLWEAGYNLKSRGRGRARCVGHADARRTIRTCASTREQHMSEGTHRDVSAFELGLDLILDGLRKMHDAG